MAVRFVTLILIFLGTCNWLGASRTILSSSEAISFLDGKPYYFVGTNYWYGGLLGLEKDKRRGVERLKRELDFLKANGVKNLRLMAGAEGTGR